MIDNDNTRIIRYVDAPIVQYPPSFPMQSPPRNLVSTVGLFGLFGCGTILLFIAIVLAVIAAGVVLTPRSGENITEAMLDPLATMEAYAAQQAAQAVILQSAPTMQPAPVVRYAATVAQSAPVIVYEAQPVVSAEQNSQWGVQIDHAAEVIDRYVPVVNPSGGNEPYPVAVAPVVLPTYPPPPSSVGAGDCNYQILLDLQGEFELACIHIANHSQACVDRYDATVKLFQDCQVSPEDIPTALAVQ